MLILDEKFYLYLGLELNFSYLKIKQHKNYRQTQLFMTTDH